MMSFIYNTTLPHFYCSKNNWENTDILKKTMVIMVNLLMDINYNFPKYYSNVISKICSF